MALVGEAHVIVRAITDKVRGDIQRGFQGSDRIAGGAGRSAGAEFNRQFRRGMGGGRGTLFSKSFEAEADRARSAFQSLIQVSNLLGPAIAGIAGGIGAAGAGLFSLGAAAAGAIPSLVVIPGMLLAAAQAAITLRLAFSGIGAALSAGLRGGTGGGGGGGIGRQALDNAEQIEAAQERIANARRRLVDVLRENVERRQEAIDRAQRAQEDAIDAQNAAIRADRDYANSQNDTRKAVEALARAREEAVEDLQQLRFETEAANLGEKRARLEFEKSRDALQRLQDLPPNSRARQEAELAFAEADLNLRRAIDRNQDLQKEEKRATAAGVDGSDKVVNAQEALIQAQRAEQDALEAKNRAWRDSNRALQEAAKAQREIGEVERENAQRTQDAIKDLRDAYDDLNDARKRVFTGGGGGGGGGIDPFAEAMSKLSKEAQDFVRYLIKIQPEFKKLQAAAGRLLFPKLETAIQNLVENLFPRLEPLLEGTGGVIGDVAIKLSETITQARNLVSLEKIWKTGDYLITAFGEAASNLVTVFLRVMEAAGPLIRRFADWVVSVTEAWRVTAEGEGFVARLEGTFKRAGDTAAQIGRIFRDTFGGLSELFKAATGPGSGGQFLLDFFEKGAAKFREFATLGNQDGSLKKYFLDASVNASKVLQLLGDIVGVFLKLGGAEGTGGFIDGLRDAVPFIQQIADYLAEAGPKLGELVAKVAELLAAFANSGAIQFFYDVLLLVADALIAIVSNPIAQFLLKIAGVLLGVGAAVGILTKLFKFLYMAMIGNVVGVVKNFANIRNAVTGAGTAAQTTTTQMRTLQITTTAAGTSMVLTGTQTTGAAAATTALGASANTATKGIKGMALALKAAFISNPILLAITAITTALTAFWMAQQNADQAAQDFADTLDEVTGKATDATFAMATQKLTENITEVDEWNRIAELTGVTLDEIAAAAVEGGQAWTDFQAKWDAAASSARNNPIYKPGDGDLLRATGNAIAAVGRDLDGAREKNELTRLATEATNKAIQSSEPVFRQSADAAEKWAESQRKAAEDVARLEGKTIGLEEAINGLTNALDVSDAKDDLVKAFKEIDAKFAGTNKVLKGNSDAALAAREGIRDTAAAVISNAQKIGGTPEEQAQRIESGLKKLRRKFIDQGFKPEDVDNYLKELNMAPDQAEKIMEDVVKAGEEAVDGMRDAGTNAGAGFVDGMAKQRGPAYAAGVALYREAQRGVNEAGAMQSPSRKMMEVGRNFVQGFVIGVQNLEEKAVNAFTKAIDRMVKGGDDKLKEWGEKAKTRFEKFVGDIKQLGEVMKTFQDDLQLAINPNFGAPDRSNLESNPVLYAQQQIDAAGASLDRLSKKLGRSKVDTDGLIAEFSTLADTLRAELTVALDQARANLDELRQRADGWKQAVQSAFGGLNIQDALAKEGEEGGKSFSEKLNEQAAKADVFADKVTKLIEAGFSESTIQQVLAAGADTGTKIADELLKGGQDAILADERLNEANKKLVEQLYQAGYAKWYETGMKQAEDNVKGVEDEIKKQFGEDSKLNRVMRRLATRLSKDVVLDVKLSKKELTVIVNAVTRVTDDITEDGRTRIRGATGGIVRRPTVALIGEAGPEAVIPLNRSPGNGPLPDSFGNNIQINVYPSPGMNENELADMVSRKLAFQMRRGTI